MFLLTKLRKKTELKFYLFIYLFIYLIILFSCAIYIAWNEILKLGELVRYRRWLLPFEVTVTFCLPGTTDEVRYKSNYPLFWL